MASAGECFKTARVLATEQLRAGELLSKKAASASANDGGLFTLGDRGTVFCAADADGLTWAIEKSELLTLAKAAVANGVVASQVAKRLKASQQLGGHARVQFVGAHNQFPVVTVAFDDP